MSVYIFGYGSLLNPKSRTKTFSEKLIIEDVTLLGYQRILNAGIPGHKDISMNIYPRKGSSVIGVLVEVQESELDNLKDREVGYEMMEITNTVNIKVEAPVYTFIMNEIDCRGKVIPQSYIDTCLGGVAKEARETWLADTIIPHEVLDDRSDPIYPNYVVLDE